MSNETRKKFETLPVIDTQHLADYFNLENGLTLFEGDEEDEELVERIKNEKFRPEHFTYVGVFEVNGVETMFWSVKGEDICATVEPGDDTYCICMDYLPSKQPKGG